MVLSIFFSYGIILVMKTRALPYGKEGWKQKKAFYKELISSRSGPPYVYNDVLLIIPSSRVRRAYGKLFLDTMEQVHHASALAQPELDTLHQFFQKLYSLQGGPPVIDETSRLVLLEGIVKKGLTGNVVFNPAPDILAPSLSAALAQMIEQLSLAGVTPEKLSTKIASTDFSDKPQVRLLTDIYARYVWTLKDHGMTDPAGMLATLADQFDPKALSAYSTIIIDGLDDAGMLEAAVLMKLAACKPCTYLINTPSSGALKRAGEFHPLRPLKDHLSRLGVHVGDDGAMIHPDDQFLSEALFSDASFAETSKKAAELPSFAKTINLFSAINTREEVTCIAGAIKRSLRNGTPADAVLVTFPSLDEYGPLVEEIFTDYGLPYNRALGRQLSASPVATAIISLLRVRQDEYSGPSLQRVLSAPFLKFSETPGLTSALDAFLRAGNVPGGKHRILTALNAPSTPKELRESLLQPLQDLAGALAPFDEDSAAPLAAWMDRLSRLLSWSGLHPRVMTVKGPLNINLQAYNKMTETIGSLERAGRLFPEYSYTFNEWLFLLKKTFMHTRFQVPPDDEGGVQILGLGESSGLQWDEIFFGGLVDARFPQRLPQNIFLPEATLEELGAHTLEKARLTAAHHFYRLLLSAPAITLTYPENERDRPTVPSPFLAELMPLVEAGRVNRQTRVQFSLRIADSGSLPELAKAMGIALSKDAKMVSQLDALATLPNGETLLRAATSWPAPAAAPTPLLVRKFTVTELDRYLRCPHEYYLANVLRIAPLEEVSEDLSPQERGSKAHWILKEFYGKFLDTPITGANTDKARMLLRALADKAFSGEPDTFRNRREKDLFITVLAERFLNAETAFWRQGLKPVYLEQTISLYPLALSPDLTVELTAKIDRIDIDKNGDFVIVDYKTGGYPQPRMEHDQDIFQLPVYAVMAEGRAFDNGPVLNKPMALAYYDLKGKFSAHARDVVLYNKDLRDDHPAAKPKASAKSAGSFQEILQASMEKAKRAAKGIIAGKFPATPANTNTCRNCVYGELCEKETGENGEKE